MDLGASRRGVDMGPSALRVAELARRLEALGHDVEADDDVSAPLPEVLLHQPTARPGPVAAFLPSITATCMELARVTADAVIAGAVPVTVGGDHSIAAGSIAGAAVALAQRGKRLGVIWLDAHGDANTPESSASGNIHGMPLANLVGHGDALDSGISAALGGNAPALLSAVRPRRCSRLTSRWWACAISTSRSAGIFGNGGLRRLPCGRSTSAGCGRSCRTRLRSPEPTRVACTSRWTSTGSTPCTRRV